MERPELCLVKENLVLRLDGEEGVVGSASDPGVQTLLNSWVSRRHLRWRRAGTDQLEIEDLDSTNGTFVRGHRLAPGQRVRLSLGGRVDLGREGDWVLTDQAHRKATFMKGAPLAVLRRLPNGDAIISVRAETRELTRLRKVQAQVVLWLAEEVPGLLDGEDVPPSDEVGWTRRDEVAEAIYRDPSDVMALNNVLDRMRKKLDGLGLPDLVERRPGGGRAAPGTTSSGLIRLRFDGAWRFQPWSAVRHG